MTAPTTEFTVDLPLFSGPFRLLADLVLDQKMDVCDVQVSGVTEAFLRRGEEAANGWTLEEATWFLAVCAVLLELKVGRLLPREVVSTEEDLLGGASPDLVYARTLELAAFRSISQMLADLMAQAALSVPREAGPPPELTHLYPDLMEKVSIEAIRSTALALLAPRRELDLSHVSPIRASLADALRAMREHLSVTPDCRFRELVEECSDRIQVVVRFLALLELYREGEVELSQAEVFGEIRVKWQRSSSGSTLGDGVPQPQGSTQVSASPEGRPGGASPLRDVEG
jgi:segregation and condensation protein A